MELHLYTYAPRAFNQFPSKTTRKVLLGTLCANLWSISHIPTWWWHRLHAHRTYIVNLQAPLQVLGSFTNQCLEDEMAQNYGHDISHPCHLNPLESRLLRIRLL